MAYEFGLRFPNAKQDAFENAWNKLSVRAISVFESHFETNFGIVWSKEISQLLAILKMLPARASGKNMSFIESSFKKAEKKLIVFREVSIEM